MMLTETLGRVLQIQAYEKMNCKEPNDGNQYALRYAVYMQADEDFTRDTLRMDY